MSICNLQVRRWAPQPDGSFKDEVIVEAGTKAGPARRGATFLLLEPLQVGAAGSAHAMADLLSHSTPTNLVPRAAAARAA